MRAWLTALIIFACACDKWRAAKSFFQARSGDESTTLEVIDSRPRRGEITDIDGGKRIILMKLLA